MHQLKRTPFYDFHIRMGGRMVDFAGWEMPLLYQRAVERGGGGIIAEHQHTRSACSVFDVSHMGRLRIAGPDALAFLQKICTRNLAKAAVGQSMYSLICNAAGGIMDDVIISRYEHDWLMVCNAGGREKLLAWFPSHINSLEVTVEDETTKTAMIAVQGPRAVQLLNALLPKPISDLKRYHFVQQRYMTMIQYTIFRSGYTGEDGLEVIAGNSAASMALNMLMRDKDVEHSMVKPAGLGARDTLRLEAGMPLYGHELSEQVDPLTAGLQWAVDLQKDFVGSATLRAVQAAGGPKARLVGLFIDGPRAARQGMAVRSDSKVVGIITSGAMSPTLKRCIAMAIVDADYIAPGTHLQVDLRGTSVNATVTPLPFYKRPG